MIARVISVARRLTIIERYLLLWVAVAPAVLSILHLILTVAYSPVSGVVVFLVYYLGVLALAGIAAAVRLRRWRQVQPVAPPRALAPVELSDRSVLADAPSTWAQLESPRLGELRVVRRLASLSRSTLLFFGLRTKAEWIREPIAYLVTAGRYDYSTLERLILQHEVEEHSQLLLAGVDNNLLLTLSRLVSSQDLHPHDQDFFRACLAYVARRSEVRLSQGNRLYLAERLILTGQLELALPILNQVGSGFTQSLLKADVLNPFHTAPLQQSLDLWLTAFNSIYQPFGLEPVSLKADGATPYDRLDARTDSVTSDGPLISVIMTCYHPDHTLVSAVDSMIAQTWQNWELLIADDCSPDEYQPFIDAVAARDARIRVLRSDVNKGTYVRRNEAIVKSRGELVTMHDSDDWAHPRRLEIQARHLIANPSLIANVSSSLRVSEELMFVQPRGATLRLTESSLLFHKGKALDKVGYFDSVRRAADSEYRLRLEAAFGCEIPTVDTFSPLALVRYGATSLSGSDLGDGWMHPARLAYRSAGDHWRKQIRAGTANPYVAFPMLERPFPAPDAVTGNPSRRRSVDLLIVVDGRAEANPAGHLDTIANEIRGLLGEGLSIGLLQVEALVEGRPPTTLAPVLQQMINDGKVEMVLVAEETHATCVIVRNASALQAAPGGSTALSTERLVVLEDRASGRDVWEQNFAKSTVDASAERLFGLIPEWMVWDSPIDYAVVRAHIDISVPDVETGLPNEVRL